MKIKAKSKGFAFASVEAFLALVFALSAIAFMMPFFSKGFSPDALYAFQLSQDLAETSLRDSQTLSEIVSFSKGDFTAEEFLEEKYSRIVEKLGDYCIELKVEGEQLKVNCREGEGAIKTKATASRIIFDPQTQDFFEAKFSVGFYS